MGTMITRLRLIIHTRRLIQQVEPLLLPIVLIGYLFLGVAVLCGIL